MCKTNGKVISSYHVPSMLGWALLIAFNSFSQSQTKLLNYITDYRASIGLSILVLNEQLTQAAKIQNDNNIQYQKCDHKLQNVEINNVHPIWYKLDKVGYTFSDGVLPGECTSMFKHMNLYKNTSAKCDNCEDWEMHILKAYLVSPPHKAGIEVPQHTKVGIITETVGEYTYNTLLFD